jgi:hypothetical protein
MADLTPAQRFVGSPTAYAPENVPGGGQVHKLTSDHPMATTVCGLETTGWSRAVTMMQELGLVNFCEPCQEVDGSAAGP